MRPANATFAGELDRALSYANQSPEHGEAGIHRLVEEHITTVASPELVQSNLVTIKRPWEFLAGEIRTWSNQS